MTRLNICKWLCAQFRNAAKEKDDAEMLKVMSFYGMELVAKVICKFSFDNKKNYIDSIYEWL